METACQRFVGSKVKASSFGLGCEIVNLPTDEDVEMNRTERDT